MDQLGPAGHALGLARLTRRVTPIDLGGKTSIDSSAVGQSSQRKLIRDRRASQDGLINVLARLFVV